MNENVALTSVIGLALALLGYLLQTWKGEVRQARADFCRGMDEMSGDIKDLKADIKDLTLAIDGLRRTFGNDLSALRAEKNQSHEIMKEEWRRAVREAEERWQISMNAAEARFLKMAEMVTQRIAILETRRGTPIG